MTDVFKAFLIPGSRLCLLVGLTLGLFFLYGPKRARTWARAWLTVITVAYWLMSLPPISIGLATRFLGDEGRVRSTADLSGASAIVVLGSGIQTYRTDGRQLTVPESQTAFNALEAARLYELRPVPVIVSGGLAAPAPTRKPESEVLRDVLVDNGVPGERILLESASRTTFEQARNVASLLKTRRWTRFALVASPGHMPRAAATFRGQGVQPVPAIAQLMSERAASSTSWLPSESALFVSQTAGYDYSAWLYYWARGRLTPSE